MCHTKSGGFTMTEKTNANRRLGERKANTRMLRVLVTPRQDKFLTQLREAGSTEAEHVRRALDEYFDRLIEKGRLKE
jgi:hypothetical protein